MTKLHSIKEQTYEIIKRKILTQQLPLGEKINIGQLSKELGVSNSPIREALNLLEKHGLVVSARNSGTHVILPSVRDKYELAQMLLFWMTGAYHYCRETGLIEQLAEEMEKAMSRQRHHLNGHSLHEYTYNAGIFDRCIIAATGNRMMITQYDNLFPLSYLCSLYDCQHGGNDYRECLRLQETMLAAVRNRDHDLVISILKERYHRPAFDLKTVQPIPPADRSDEHRDFEINPPEFISTKSV